MAAAGRAANMDSAAADAAAATAAAREAIGNSMRADVAAPSMLRHGCTQTGGGGHGKAGAAATATPAGRGTARMARGRPVQLYTHSLLYSDSSTWPRGN